MGSIGTVRAALRKQTGDLYSVAGQLRPDQHATRAKGIRMMRGGGPRVTGETSSIDAIVSLMRDNWDMPADCNDGELYTYAEHLRDRIMVGDDAVGLEDYLRAIQTDKLDMLDSAAYRVIAQGAVVIVAAGPESNEERDKRAAITDEDALPEMPKSESEKYDGSPV